jgi:hypothetical protein
MTKVYLESGKKKVFASAVDWPGWSRSGKDEESALDALATYAVRYSGVAATAGLDLPADAGDIFEIVERLLGDMTTDFGAPGAIAASDHDALTTAEEERLATLLQAAWTFFDQVAATTPAELRKGPRGGGRDRDKMVDHVLGAEVAYARKIGIRHRQPALDDGPAIAALRAAIVVTVRPAPGGTPVQDTGWPPRYAVRRLAWHVLDHAWEMQDRS